MQYKELTNAKHPRSICYRLAKSFKKAWISFVNDLSLKNENKI